MEANCALQPVPVQTGKKEFTLMMILLGCMYAILIGLTCLFGSLLFSTLADTSGYNSMIAAWTSLALLVLLVHGIVAIAYVSSRDIYVKRLRDNVICGECKQERNRQAVEHKKRARICKTCLHEVE